MACSSCRLRTPLTAVLLSSYEGRTGVKIAFVIGHTTNLEQETAVAREAETYGGFMRLPLEVPFPRPASTCYQASGGVLAGSAGSWCSQQSCCMQEDYFSLTQKTLAFLKATTEAYDARYIVKIDDDVFLRTDRLPHALQQYEAVHAGAQPSQAARLHLACEAL